MRSTEHLPARAIAPDRQSRTTTCQPLPVAIDLDARRGDLEQWLAARLPDAPQVRLGDFDRPTSGFSAETLILPVHVERGGTSTTERLVLRIETPDPAVYPQQAPGLDVEIEIQVRVMEVLAAASAVPVAPLVGYEPDPGVLGAPFFVMRFIEGEVPIENPIYTQSGFFVDASPDLRAQMIDDGLRTLANVHAVDWQATHLEWLVAPGTTPGLDTQLDLWEAYADRELDGRVHPRLAEAFTGLRAERPTASPVTLSWGDPRPGNIIWRDGRCVCATDFEAAAIAPPEVDLGWWLMFDRWSHESMGAERLPGEQTRDEQREIYARHAGRTIDDTRYWEIFAAARYAAIVVRVMNRMVARGDMPADHTIWLDNPATTCLVQLLDE